MTAFPGGIPSEAVNLKAWQFGFNRLNDLPEMLTQGREREYLAWIFATKSFRTYAIELGRSGRIHASVFRARRNARRL